MMSDLKGIRVAILATDGVEQAELTEPRKFLDQLGAETILLSPKTGQIQAMQHDEKSEKIKVDRVLEGADPNEFDAVLLPGGALNADHLRVDKDAQRFVQEIDRAQKPIAVICHAPWLLVSAKLTKGRKMTSYHTISGRRSQFGRGLERRAVGAGSQLGEQPPAVGHPSLQPRDRRAVHASGEQESGVNQFVRRKRAEQLSAGPSTALRAGSRGACPHAFIIRSKN
jgi:protease I